MVMSRMLINRKAGFSLIEVMVAALILAVLVIGIASALYYAGAIIQDQETKRLAVDQVVERMELVKRSNYSIIKPPAFGTPYYYVDDNQDNVLAAGERTSSAETETDKAFPMTTVLVRFPQAITGGFTNTEYSTVSVNVTYGRFSLPMTMESIIVP